jgi:hypothetical protein
MPICIFAHSHHHRLLSILTHNQRAHVDWPQIDFQIEDLADHQKALERSIKSAPPHKPLVIDAKGWNFKGVPNLIAEVVPTTLS